MSKRYLREGPDKVIHQVYPGTLSGLDKARADAKRMSLAIQGEHMVSSHDPHQNPKIEPLQIWENGELTWVPDNT